MANAAPAQTLTFDQPELVGISGFRVMWDESVPLAEDGAVEYSDAQIKDKHGSALWHPSQREGKPGPIAFDALQRSILVRFPGAAEQIAAKLNAGVTIEKVELVLPFRDTELWPVWGKDLWDPKTGGYTARRNWGVDKLYRESQPNWHAVAWALRKPWSAEDPKLAPTYNAYINGAGYWAHSGAQDEQHDRFPTRFGPTEVSTYNPDGRMDVTAVLSDAAFGATVGERLRVVADQGFVVRKWETYDHRYFNGVYEWATATGGRAILVNTPKLVVTLRSGGGEKVTLPTQPQVAALARQLARTGEGGQPQARLMTEDELMAFNAALNSKPAWMPDWQYERVRELRDLRNLGKATRLDQDLFFDIFLNHHIIVNMYGGKFERGKGRQPAAAYERYQAWVDQLLARQPRGWSGFEAAKEMAQWYTYGEALPQPAKDAIKTYWTAWLMPEQETAPTVKERHNPKHDQPTLIHPMADQLWGEKGKGGTSTYITDTYYALTGDWRGNKSFYRSGFLYEMSTQNFNTTASAGALLGGAIINEPIPIADGRHGFQNFPLSLWAWRNGSSQEHIDHYYFSITMSGNKAVWDFGPDPYDRMLGRSVVAYNMEELLGAWHPNLRRFIAPASRTTLEHVLVATDGIQQILHTLSKRGTLFDYDKEQHVPTGMKLIGHEVPPEIVALQAMPQAWAPLWTTHLVDDKKLPFYATHRVDDAWRRAYLGENYGLASLNITMPRLQVLAQWRGDESVVDQNTDLRTMDIRFGYNETRFASTGAGHLGRTGSVWNLQHKNKLLSVMSPLAYWNGPNGVGVPGDGKPKEITSLQSSIIVFNYQDKPGWKMYAAGKPITSLPATAKQGEPITIADGPTYIGVIPLPSTDLGRDVEVSIDPGTTQNFEKVEVASAFTINNYMLRRDKPLTRGEDDFEKIDDATGGFYVEMHDAKDWPSFEAFQQHMGKVTLASELNAEQAFVTTTATSGEDVLTLGAPHRADKEKPDQMKGNAAFAINGGPAFPNLLRATDTSVIGKNGSLELDGATLSHREDATAYMQHEPVSDTWRAMIPTPAGSWLHLTLPDGRRVRTDGRVNLFDAIVHADGHVEMHHALNPKVDNPNDKFASVVVMDGFQSQPRVTLNGEPVQPGVVELEGKPAWAVLVNRRTAVPDAATLTARLESPQ